MAENEVAQELQGKDAKDKGAKDKAGPTRPPQALKIELAIEDVLALQDLLTKAEPKGRSEMRNHSKLYREFNKKCRNYTDEQRMEFKWKPGTVEYTDEGAIEYLISILNKRVDAGIQGALSIGYMVLLEAADEYKREK